MVRQGSRAGQCQQLAVSRHRFAQHHPAQRAAALSAITVPTSGGGPVYGLRQEGDAPSARKAYGLVFCPKPDGCRERLTFNLT